MFEILERAGMVRGADPSEDGPGIVAECPQDRRKGVGCPDGSGECGSNEPGASFGGEVSLAEKAAEWMASHPEAMGLFERLGVRYRGCEPWSHCGKPRSSGRPLRH